MKKVMIFFVVLFLMVYGLFKYQVSYKKTEISEYSHDHYVLTIYMIGEPEWPFGRTHCSLVLKKENHKVIEYKFNVRNDGCSVSKNNFDVKWYEEYCLLLSNGEEQPEIEYKIDYQGNVLENKKKNR